MKYILDTDICIFALKQRMGVLRRLLKESPDDIAVSAMTEAELVFGALKSSQPERAGTQVAAFLEYGAPGYAGETSWPASGAGAFTRHIVACPDEGISAQAVQRLPSRCPGGNYCPA